MTEKTQFPLGTTCNSICSQKNVIWHFVYTPTPTPKFYENFISHSVSMTCKIYSFTFLLLALKCTKYPVLPHCRINSIHNYVLSWVRTYLRDDYISIVIKFGCVHHGRKVKQVLCWKCKQLQYLFQSLSVEAEKQ